MMSVDVNSNNHTHGIFANGVIRRVRGVNMNDLFVDSVRIVVFFFMLRTILIIYTLFSLNYRFINSVLFIHHGKFDKVLQRCINL